MLTTDEKIRLNLFKRCYNADCSTPVTMMREQSMEQERLLFVRWLYRTARINDC